MRQDKFLEPLGASADDNDIGLTGIEGHLDHMLEVPILDILFNIRLRETHEFDKAKVRLCMCRRARKHDD